MIDSDFLTYTILSDISIQNGGYLISDRESLFAATAL